MHPTTEHRTISTRKHQLHHPKPHPRNRKRLPLRGPATPRKSLFSALRNRFRRRKTPRPPGREKKNYATIRKNAPCSFSARFLQRQGSARLNPIPGVFLFTVPCSSHIVRT